MSTKGGRVMRYFLDTEFDENGKTIELISIGVYREDGATFYRISADFDPARCNEWVVANVLPHLGDAPRETRDQIRDGLLAFVGDDEPEFWGYFADYDWVVLCQLFGRMIDLPKNFPMFCMDLKQWAKQLGVMPRDIIAKPANEHNALADARWNADLFAALRTIGSPK